MRADEIMNQEVVAIAPDASIADAAKLMAKEGVSGLPVIAANHELVGIVTEGDLLRRAETDTTHARPHWLELFISMPKLADEYVRERGRKVSEIMSRDVACVQEDTPVRQVVEIMQKRGIKRLPVLREGRVVGIISRSNLVRALALTPPPSAAPTSDDKRIQSDLERELKAQSWKPRRGHIMVRDGIIDISGIVTSARQRDAIKVAAENIPGCKGVRDHMTWVEPRTGRVVSAGLASETEASDK